MDFILFFIGFICLLRNKIAAALAFDLIILSGYLQIVIRDPFWVNYMFPHNVSDTGLLLYILIFIRAVRNGHFRWNTPLTAPFMVFASFLILNGIYDYFHGTAVMDIINFLKHRIPFTIIFISSQFSRQTVIKSFKYIMLAAVISSLYILIDRFVGLNLVNLRINSDIRGVKPSFTSMIYPLALFANLFNQTTAKRLVYGLILVVPVILNMKMTYAMTIFLSIALYIFISKQRDSTKTVGMALGLMAGVLIVFTTSDKFSDRFDRMTNESINVESSKVEGNFSYRILHTYERLNYICKDPVTAIRGMGYVSERNFKQQPFKLGVYDEKAHRVAQLDTGDIAWSLFFPRYGLLGTALFLIFYFAICRQFYRQTGNPFRDYWLSILPVYIAFTSFGNATVMEPYFLIFPLLFSMKFPTRLR